MNLNSAIETILNKRGISAADDVAEFLSDKPSLTYDPFLLKDMYEGVDLIMMAVETGQKICIYGDNDGRSKKNGCRCQLLYSFAF